MNMVTVGDMMKLKNPEPVGPITSKTAFVVVCVGQHAEDCLKITEPRFKEYAAKCSMDYVVIRDDLCPAFPMFNKFRIINVLENYESIFYVDTDVIISRDSPNIEEVYSKDKILFYDELYDCLFGQGHPGWANREAKEVSFSQTGVEVGLKLMANGGVLYIPRKYKHYYRPPDRDVPLYQCTDQILLTTRIWHAVNVYNLIEYKWNCGYVSPSFWERFQDSYFIHANSLIGYSRLKFLEFVDKNVA
jgi:hypothetical protein